MMPVAKKARDAQAGASYAPVGSDEIGGIAANSSPCRIVSGASRYAEAASFQATMTNTTCATAHVAAAARAAAASLRWYSSLRATAPKPKTSVALTIAVKMSVDTISPSRENSEVRPFRTATSTGVNSPGVAFRFEKLIYISYKPQNVNTFCQIGMLHPWSNLRLSLAKSSQTAYTYEYENLLGI